MKILVIGNCGVGKTWLMKSLIKHFKAEKRQKIGKFYYHTNDQVIVIGKYDGNTFEGSDRLSMAVVSDLDAFLKYTEGKTIIAEGDRFTNNTYISKATPTIIKILGDGSEGRTKRGSNQTERHIKSIQTRVKNINSHYEVENSIFAFQLIIKLITDDKQ